MTLFEYLCTNQRIVKDLVLMGVVPTNIESNIFTYRKYLEYRQTCKRMQAVENTAEDMKLSSRYTHIIIQKMEQEV